MEKSGVGLDSRIDTKTRRVLTQAHAVSAATGSNSLLNNGQMNGLFEKALGSKSANSARPTEHTVVVASEAIWNASLSNAHQDL